MNKIITSLLCLCFLTSFVSAQKGYDELTREMEQNKNDIIKEVNSFNAAFDDVFETINSNTSRLIMGSIGSVIVCFFIFLFVYVRSRKHFTRLVTAVIMQENKNLVVNIASENQRFMREIEGLVGHTQKLRMDEFVPLDSYIEDALPEYSAAAEKKKEEEEIMESSKAAISNGMGTDAPVLPKTLLKKLDRSKKKSPKDASVKKRKSRKEKRKEAEASMKIAEGKLNPKPTLQELDNEIPILEPLPKDLKALSVKPPKNTIFDKFKRTFNGRKEKQVTVEPEQVTDQKVKIDKKQVSKKKTSKQAPLKSDKKNKKKGILGKVVKIMTSSPNELIGKGDKDAS